MVEPVYEDLKKTKSELEREGKGDLKSLAKTLKLSYFEEPQWLGIIGPDGKVMQIFHMCPRDELHQWFVGVVGDYIFPAIIHRYDSELRKPHLLKKNRTGDLVPFFSDADIMRAVKRIAVRLESISSSETMLSVPPGVTASFIQMYLKYDTKVKLTGERMKALQLVSPFVFRQLLAPEVLFFSIQDIQKTLKDIKKTY
jgi:hypothetical protein